MNVPILCHKYLEPLCSAEKQAEDDLAKRANLPTEASPPTENICPEAL